MDISDAKFEQYSEKIVKVSGSRFVKSDTYTVKLEGASLVGYRSVCIAGVRDPFFIKSIDAILERVKEEVGRTYEGRDYHLIFRLYGKNGVMGPLEPVKTTPHEVGMVIEAVAKTREDASAICGRARVMLAHIDYEGQLNNTNLAYPFSPRVVEWGPAYTWTVHHLLELDDPCECFPMTLVEVG